MSKFKIARNVYLIITICLSFVILGVTIVYLIGINLNDKELEQFVKPLFNLQLPSNIQDINSAESISFETYPNDSKCVFEGRRTVKSNLTADEISVYFQNN